MLTWSRASRNRILLALLFLLINKPDLGLKHSPSEKDGYNDFNTFYMQAASGTKGGSSGSPVIDWKGRAVALNAGSKSSSASAFFLPLERGMTKSPGPIHETISVVTPGKVVRALKFLQKGDSYKIKWEAISIPRGTLQTTFVHKGFDEIRRLGLQSETEQMVRLASAQGETGMLVIDSVVPGGPGHKHLEPGDVLVRVNGEWANAIGCSVGHFPSEYLGLPLGVKRNSTLMWDPVLQKFYKKLAGWKAKTMSMVKAVLCSLPIYFMSLFKIPSSVIVKLNSIMAKFLWGGGVEDKFPAHASWIWKSVFQNHFKEDQFGDKLFVLSLNMNGKLKEFGEFQSSVWSWHVQLRRNLSDWELEQFSDLMAIIHNITLSHDLSDGLIWKGNGEGIYSVKSSMKSCCPVSTTDSFWMRCIWRGLVPPRVEVFMWQVVYNRLAVKQELQRRGVSAIVDVACPFCKEEVESSAHLFFTCTVAWNLWNKFLKIWGVCSVLQDNAQSFMVAWEEMVLNSKIWSFIPGVVLWTIWKTRNDIVFDGGRVDQMELFFMARCRLATWFLAKFNDVAILKDSLISDPTLGDCCSNPRLSIIKTVSWYLPPKGFIKLNVDAAVNGDWRKSGVGGILRVEDGSVMGSFQEAVGPGPPLLIEIMAIKKGLSFFALIHQRFKEYLIVESDSKLAVEWVKNYDCCAYVYKVFVKDIVILLRDLNGIIRWVPRSANVEADSLAKAVDDRVEQKIELQIERGGTPLSVQLAVQDLHSITPAHFLEVSGAVIHPLSYQQARNFRFQCGLVYVSEPGYMLFRAAVPRHAIIKKFAGEEISKLEDLISVLSKHSRGARVPLEYISYQDRHRKKSVLVTVDRHEWYASPQIYTRDDSFGLWTAKPAFQPESMMPSSGVNGEATHMEHIHQINRQELTDGVSSMETCYEHASAELHSENEAGICSKKRRVEEDMSSDGVVAEGLLNETGEFKLVNNIATENPVLSDYPGPTAAAANASIAERVIEPTLVMFEVHVPPSCMLDVAISSSDVMLSFAAYPIEIPGEVVFLHPVHNYAIVAYDPLALGPAGASVVRAAELLPGGFDICNYST
ncbi:Protease Do-like 7 [Hibiscus syriacus]|uniref:Protease Do-like 7 n=1 Tax=Hibiscus syriacus TaxID=106335 RepID=A0A6A2XWR5_HIBSY|nr:Protease Do-like 7 [Hibiscus syriacus]